MFFVGFSNTLINQYLSFYQNTKDTFFQKVLWFSSICTDFIIARSIGEILKIFDQKDSWIRMKLLWLSTNISCHFLLVIIKVT